MTTADYRQRGWKASQTRISKSDDPPPGTFAAALRAAREDAGLSQKQLAVRSGCVSSYVSRLENNERNPTLDAVVSLANALDCSAVQADELRVAAGYLPRNVANLLADDPIAVEVYRTLSDGSLPADVQADLRSAIRAALRQAQRAVVGGAE
jgi:transcriptional regulator with XRE-family HTH domain